MSVISSRFATPGRGCACRRPVIATRLVSGFTDDVTGCRCRRALVPSSHAPIVGPCNPNTGSRATVSAPRTRNGPDLTAFGERVRFTR